PTLAGYREGDIDRLYRALRNDLVALPGVTAVSWSDVRLLAGSLWSATMRQTGPEHDGDAEMQVDVVGVGPGFFDTLQIALLAGRPLSAAGVAQAPSPERGVSPALVNEAYVRRFGGALGQTLRYKSDQPSPTWEIVGVVRDTKYSDLRAEIRPTIY